MAERVQGLLIREDGTAEMVDIVGDLATLKSIVGGWLEIISPSTLSHGEWHAYVDEEGKLKRLPPNRAATEFATACGWFSGGDYLCGPVLFLGEQESEEADVPPLVVGEAVRAWGLPPQEG